MRSDENTPKDGDYDPSMSVPFGFISPDSSLSGHERNVLFLSREGRQFEDVSNVSGANHPADGRAVGLLDYDQDGWQDLVAVNANAPQVQLFRNQLGDLPGRTGRSNSVALRLIGGNQSARSEPALSNRDAVGARIEIELEGAVLVREVRAGEGFAAQNSSTILVGVGDAPEIARLRVRWPSGKVQEGGPFPVGSLVVVSEANDSERGAFRVDGYAQVGLAAEARRRQATEERRGRKLSAAARSDTRAPLRLLTTMATWCEACKAELPQIQMLRETFSPEEVELIGVPIDEDDDATMLDAYEAEYHPAYRLDRSLGSDQIDEVREVVLQDLRLDVLPATIATDAQGRVIETLWELPSVSKVRRLLEAVDS